MESRKLLVFAEDRDVAEVAAFGLRMHEGWEPVIATSAAQASRLTSEEKVAGIAVIVIQPSGRVSRTLSKLVSLASELRVPLIGITPEPMVQEQFALLGVKTECTPFDPIGMWERLPASA